MRFDTSTNTSTNTGNARSLKKKGVFFFEKEDSFPGCDLIFWFRPELKLISVVLKQLELVRF